MPGNGRWTPGPWTVYEPAADQRHDGRGHCRGIYGPPRDEYDDGRIVETDSGVYPPCLADAYLIASAPSLYDACQTALDEMQMTTPCGCSGGFRCTRCKVLDTLKAALGRARGEGGA